MTVRPMIGLVAVAIAIAITSCSSGNKPAADATTSPAAVSTTTASDLPIGPTTSPTPTTAPPVHIPARDLADPALPSHLGSGKPSKATVKRLMQFFENRVSEAYATGNADALYHYLAGPMLSGNRAT